jgi:hypothetical protein
MMFILIQKTALENRKKKWLDKHLR